MATYKYKSVIVKNRDNDYPIKEEDLNYLNQLYMEGWEFVNSIAQNAGVGGGNYTATKFASIIFTLKRTIPD